MSPILPNLTYYMYLRAVLQYNAPAFGGQGPRRRERVDDAILFFVRIRTITRPGAHRGESSVCQKHADGKFLLGGPSRT